MTELLSTPSQTVGPYLHIALPWPDGPGLVGEHTPGSITIVGHLTDGAAEPVADGLLEIWQADESGGFSNRGFGRCQTGAGGQFWFRTVKPAALPAEQGLVEAPHLDISIFARGLLQRLVTRMYFPDEETANAADPVLAALSVDDRALLIAHPQPGGSLRFDIRLQGEHETPFFEV
jgi:protocatechuate 3,4-dioxygenase alpha subunit